jgi:hypothetical protein
MLLFLSDGAEIVDCLFDRCVYYGIIAHTGTRNVRIVGCEFVGNAAGVGTSFSENAVVAFCTFVGGGVQYSEGSTGQIYRCSFTGRWGIDLNAGASVSLVENRINAAEQGLIVWNFAHVTGERNVIGGASYATLCFRGTSTADFHGNHILKGSGPTVRVDGYVLEPIQIDLTDNYWGTTSADSLSAWILDGNDPHPPWETWNGFVVFQPFAERPVPAPTTSFGSLKALLGGGGK